MNRRAVLLLAVLVASPVMGQTTQSARSWLTSVDAGYIESQKTQKPVLVLVSDDRAGSAWDKPLADAKVSAKLDGWVLVRLGPEQRDLRQQLGVAQTPALRAMSPAGRIVSRLDGFATVEQLRKWLEDAATAAVPAAGSDDVAALVASLGSPDAVVREAATRQLLARRAASASAVVDVLASDNATARIAAADLLEAWEAPLTGIDPWQRSTATPERLAELKTWAEGAAFTETEIQPYDEKRVAADLDQLLSAASAADARAVRERLVRFGEAILPQVYQRLRDARSPEARTRLIALRYRVCATDALAAAWPGGFDRLAAADSFTRRAALDELPNRITAADTRLLIELFGDDDAVVRERSLAQLKVLGGKTTSASLLKLLADPEPNVRAAVLKTLVAGERNEKVDPALAPELAKYVAAEKDPDLLVHAIHVLKAIPGQPSADVLRDLLPHAEWRVRAEAADALREKLAGYGEGRLEDADKAKLYTALAKLLDDEEGFVVAKAVAALAGSHLTTTVEPLLKAVDRRPDMGAEILKVIAGDSEMAKLAAPHLGDLVKHERPDVRAAAVKAMAAGAPATSGEAIKLSLADKDPRVRAAGVVALVAVLDSEFPEDGYVKGWTGGLLFGRSERKKVDVAKWVDDYRSGKAGRPAWMGELAPALQQTLADSPEPNLTAAVALSALGKDDVAFPTLLAAARKQDAAALEALKWLPWDKRRELFAAYIAAVNAEQRGLALAKFAEVPDPRAADLIWSLLPADLPAGDWAWLLHHAHDALQSIYFGQRYYDMESVSASQKKLAREQLGKFAASGSAPQRVVAIALLMRLDKSQAENAAAAMQADPASTDELRVSALQLRLLALADPDKASPVAVAALSDAKSRSVAIRYLAAGEESLSNLRGIYLPTHSSSPYVSSPVTVDVPKGLVVEPLRAALADSNPDVQGYAAYLLVLLDQRDALKKLEDVWRLGANQRVFSRLLYRAIAKANDDSKTPLLAEIYATYSDDSYQVREFYWTIRSMTGENVLKLRKKIRDEVGMNRLK